MNLVLCQVKGACPYYDFYYYRDGKRVNEKLYDSTPVKAYEIKYGKNGLECHIELL